MVICLYVSLLKVFYSCRILIFIYIFVTGLHCHLLNPVLVTGTQLKMCKDRKKVHETSWCPAFMGVLSSLIGWKSHAGIRGGGHMRRTCSSLSTHALCKV